MITAVTPRPLRDTYNRIIDYIRISITDRCNLKCVYCMPSEGLRFFKKRDLMTDDEILRFIRIAVRHGLRKVRITGGEPLMRRDCTGLVSSIKKTGVRDLSMTSNGILLSEAAEHLKKAGLDRVNISLDTMKPDRYMSITGGGDIDAVWESIKRAEETGLTPVKINVVPIRGMNDDEIVSFASLTFDNDFHIRFIEFMPAARGGIWHKEKCVSSAESMEKISALGGLEHLSLRVVLEQVTGTASEKGHGEAGG